MARKERSDSINAAVKRVQPKSVIEYDVPDGFDLNDQERACYVSYLQQRDAWSVAQRHQLAHLAKAETLCNKIRSVIEAEGELVTLPNGISTPHPGFKILSNNERLIVQLHGKLGFAIEARDAHKENQRSKSVPNTQTRQAPKGPPPDWTKLAAEMRAEKAEAVKE